MVHTSPTDCHTAARAAYMTEPTRDEPVSVPPPIRNKPVPRVHYKPNLVSQPDSPSPGSRCTPRRTFLESLVNTEDVQFAPKRRSSSDLLRYFHGPRDLEKHTKWPIFFRMHGSVLPKLIVPLILVAMWSTVVTVICRSVHNLGVDNILLTVTGLVVGLALSFQSSTAYERWADGRKYWSLLQQTSRNLARTIWINTVEREGELGKEDLLEKLTAMNLIVAFAVALKHKLRFEPDIAYNDLAGLVGHLDTFAKDAYDPHVMTPEKSLWKSIGEHLSLSFAESDPRKHIKRSKKPLGHLPLEILNHLSVYVDQCVDNDTLSSNVHQAQAINSLAIFNEVITGTERVLDTPLPTAYTISIAQITWIYILALPFQLYNTLFWVTIPSSIAAAYVILGIAAIGREIENPFGHDVNDLPLDTYCQHIAQELDIITASPPPRVGDFTTRDDNLVLYPLSTAGYSEWKEHSVKEIRSALRTKVIANPSPLYRRSGSTLFGNLSAGMSSDQTLYP
ncbi:UPF0187-domain-containing protein [Aspergillus leporis]|uniref:UPF0187-domain-containing protein n=1 Tax=Aspergillus leporis TaxID=41062 RepID=A0A5N5WGC3_9EURO|nr:UPF0187-domain-containing protein [Aspergillus leporis]